VPRIRDNPAFETECIEFFAEIVQAFGVPRSIGQIYGLLFASNEPLSFSDIVGRLNMSKGSISQGLQLLRSLGAIHVATATTLAGKGDGEASRREYFEPELGLRRLMSGVLRERFDPAVRDGSTRLARLKDLAKDGPKPDPFYLERVRQLETWRRKLKLTLPVLRAVLGPKESTSSH